MSETSVRESIVRWGKSLFERGLTSGASGNISVRIDGGFLMTPTNACLGFLTADRLVHVNDSGDPISGGPPTKELPLHLAYYRSRQAAGAVVHLHSTYATALSCLTDINPDDAIPPLTPYVVMRLGKVPLLPYARPGSADIVPRIAEKAPDHPGLLLANHGPVVAGATLEAAIFAIEELEEAAKLVVLTRGMAVRHLDATAVADLEATFRLK